MSRPRTHLITAHSAVIAASSGLVASLAQVIPNVSHNLLFIGGVIVAMAGFAGIWIDHRDSNRTEKSGTRYDRDDES